MASSSSGSTDEHQHCSCLLISLIWARMVLIFAMSVLTAARDELIPVMAAMLELCNARISASSSSCCSIGGLHLSSLWKDEPLLALVALGSEVRTCYQACNVALKTSRCSWSFLSNQTH